MSKYRARKTVCHYGHTHASMLEAKRCEWLTGEQALGQIQDLEQQPVYPIAVNGVAVGKYVGDFRYRIGEQAEPIIEDVKGVRTATYRLKKKLVEAIYPVIIAEYPPKALKRRKARAA